VIGRGLSVTLPQFPALNRDSGRCSVLWPGSYYWNDVHQSPSGRTATLLASAQSSRAQDALLKGLLGVRVVVDWTGGSDPDRNALQTDVEMKLRQAGMSVLAPPSGQAWTSEPPMLFVGVGGTGGAGPVGRYTWLLNCASKRICSATWAQR
jgi:hypothetical protein